MLTNTILEEMKHPNTTLRPFGQKIFDALQRQQCPVKLLPGTTAFTLGDIIIRSPYREDTCICDPGSINITQLNYAKCLLRGVRRDLNTQKMLAELPAKRAEEESKKLDVQALLQRRSEEKRIRDIRIEIDRYREDNDNSSETSDTPHLGLPSPRGEDESPLEDQEHSSPAAAKEDKEDEEKDLRDSKLLPTKDW